MSVDNRGIIEHYNQNARRYGLSQEALGWTGGRHWKRFDALTSGIDFSGTRILDVGCGYGSLLEYLGKRGVSLSSISYTGIDIVPAFIEEARRQWGQLSNVNFETQDVYSFRSQTEFDWVICNGTFSLESGRNNRPLLDYLTEVVGRTFAIANRGVALSFVSNRVDWRDSHTLYVDPAVALAAALIVSPSVSLTTRPFNFEFFLQLTREDRSAFDGAT